MPEAEVWRFTQQPAIFPLRIHQSGVMIFCLSYVFFRVIMVKYPFSYRAYNLLLFNYLTISIDVLVKVSSGEAQSSVLKSFIL